MKKLILLLLISLLVFTNVRAETFDPPSGSIAMQAIDPSNFVSRWDTKLTSTGSSTSMQIKLPLVSSGFYDFAVDWGDGKNDTITSYNQIEVTHTYISDGVYTLVINGSITGWQFNNDGDRLKIIEISQWGNFGLGNTGSYFYGCSNLVLTATDAPNLTGTTSLYQAFRDCNSLGNAGSMDTWDVSSVLSMYYMFSGASSFNRPIGNWDVSSVLSMGYMFLGASSFNRPIGNWDVSSVISMTHMFSGASSFNISLENWNVSNVTTMDSMFDSASSFNQPLENWDVSSVTNMRYMFDYASTFNQPIGNWNVTSVTTMRRIFNHAFSFNQSIGNWDVSSVTIMDSMFYSASSFNYSLENWDVSSVTDMGWMFHQASSFNQPIGNWDVSSVIDMQRMFSEASSFNQSLENWDVSSVTTMYYMFSVASSFNQPIGNWDVSSVTDMTSMFLSAISFNQYIGDWDVSRVTYMGWMFYRAYSFNQPLENWDVSSVTDMRNTFYEALSFNQPVGSWDVSSVIFIYDMFSGATLSYQNYDDLLIGWADLTLQSNVVFHGGYSKYSINATTARQYIIDFYGWSISDGGFAEITPPEVSNPDDISYKMGVTGNQIRWDAGDQNPGIYDITVDGVLHTNDNWTNGTITVDIDGLAVGIYEFIIFVYDLDGNMASDTVIVTVLEITPPDISSPNDSFYEQGTTGNQIIWSVGDQNPGTYNITIDGLLYTTGTWVNGTISMDIDGLAVGVHMVILNVYDTSGNMISDMVEVTVTDNTSNASDTTTPNTPTTTSSNITESPFNTIILVLSIGIITNFRRRRDKS